MYHQITQNLSNCMCIYLNESSQIFKTFTPRVVFAIVLSFESHQDCFRFKTSGKNVESAFNIELMGDQSDVIDRGSVSSSSTPQSKEDTGFTLSSLLCAHTNPRIETRSVKVNRQTSLNEYFLEMK